MKYLIDWIKRHMFFSWTLASVIFVLIIHVLFSKEAPTAWFSAKWGAGDILTYTSTVALGLLAIWQNKKYKEESDNAQKCINEQNTEAQNRLEKISMKANELSTISRIAEIEAEYIRSLDNALELFYKECDLNSRLFKWENLDEAAGEIIGSGHRIIERYENVMGLLLGGYSIREYDIKQLCQQCEALRDCAMHIINNHLDADKERISGLEELISAQHVFIQSKRTYLSVRQRNLHRILFEEMTLAEIRAKYVVPEDNIIKEE